MLAGLLSVTPGRAAGVGDQPELGGDDDLVAAPGDGAADDLLAEVRAVDLRGVDVGDAEVEGAVDGADRLAVVQGALAGVGAGHGHGAEADAGDLEVPEVCVLHRCVPLSWFVRCAVPHDRQATGAPERSGESLRVRVCCQPTPCGRAGAT